MTQFWRLFWENLTHVPTVKRLSQFYLHDVEQTALAFILYTMYSWDFEDFLDMRHWTHLMCLFWAFLTEYVYCNQLVINREVHSETIFNANSGIYRSDSVFYDACDLVDEVLLYLCCTSTWDMHKSLPLWDRWTSLAHLNLTNTEATCWTWY